MKLLETKHFGASDGEMTQRLADKGGDPDPWDEAPDNYIQVVSLMKLNVYLSHVEGAKKAIVNNYEMVKNW